MKYKVLITGLLLICLAGVTVSFVSGKVMIAGKLQQKLIENGFKNSRITLADAGLDSAFFRDITIGDDANILTLKTLSIRYSPIGILKGRVRELKARDMALDVQAGKGSIKIKILNGELHEKQGSQDSVSEQTWQLHDIQVESEAAALPVMAGGGVLKTSGNNFSLTGVFRSKDNLYRAEFRLNKPHSGTLIYAAMPWKSGTLSTKNVDIDIEGKQPVKLTLHIQGVSVDGLMQALTGERVSATGTISGDVPVIIEHDGSLFFGEGGLHADGAGTITMPPDAIPGDNEQVAMTREILKNFHYGALSITINHKGKEISLLAVLEGTNPDFYNGRAVKLNVRLGGDLLDLVRQNIVLLTDPEEILNQGSK